MRVGMSARPALSSAIASATAARRASRSSSRSTWAAESTSTAGVSHAAHNTAAARENAAMRRAYNLPGLRVVEHELEVPLDHARPDGERITVFAREVADPDGRDRPFLVYFQGGPGFESPRPTRHPSSPGWLDRALRDYRVLMLDQRGTGRSTPVGQL